MTALSEKLGVFYCDPNRITQVLTNLGVMNWNSVLRRCLR
ncbi:hypothetical protein AVDCRST_MAG92-4439 [uncultured Coleofasciculus sp.]|uniref:Uncharacterized protein n=1 Tax=uncultured Coleofasciculus sp. TaxID=1267456 RepID=A0A6J4K150_9CYAN|nr:hypothetical protein AVDCRST_MAG92-4439 [uncultured Coleofasciculus sp.]